MPSDEWHLRRSGLQTGGTRAGHAFRRMLPLDGWRKVCDWTISMLLEFVRDLRFGGRLLRRSPTFTATAILSLALGIGGATSVFTLVNAVVLRTLPVPQPQQLYRAVARTADARAHGELFSVPLFERARDELTGKGRDELTGKGRDELTGKGRDELAG